MIWMHRMMGVTIHMLPNLHGHLPDTCGSLNPIYRNRQDEMKYTFDVGKCDKIYDELLRIGKIRLSHAIPPIEELKK
jgi:hypothetical protein